MNLTANVAGVFFYGDTPPSGSGFVIDPDGLEGLDDGISARGETVQRARAHGDYDLPTFLDSRIVSLSGNCLADSPGELAQFGRVLTGLLADSSGKVVFTHLGNTMWGAARLAPGTQKKFKVASVNSTEASFQVQLKFADPRLFGEAKTFAAAELAYHYGNFAAIPVFTISGNMPGGYAIDGPGGKQFRVTKPLVPGEPHVVDMATGWLTVGGVVQTGVVVRADVWVIPAGAQVINYVTPITTGSATTSILVRSTYI